MVKAKFFHEVLVGCSQVQDLDGDYDLLDRGVGKKGETLFPVAVRAKLTYPPSLFVCRFSLAFVSQAAVPECPKASPSADVVFQTFFAHSARLRCGTERPP